MRTTALALLAVLLLVPSAVAQPPSKPTTGGTAPTKKAFEDMTPEERKADHDATMAKAVDGATPLFVLVLLIAGGVVFTFAPTAIALVRGHNNTLPIFLVCLFLGWSCVGWIAALIWSFSDNTAANDNWKYNRR